MLLMHEVHKVKGTKEDDARQWAFATLGTVVGYWLKG